MLSMLIAYNAAGEIIATLDHLVTHDENGEAVGLVDFEATEEAGGKLRDFWNVSGATGSGSWPEWIGSRAHDFKVELGADNRIKALKHKGSGHRRSRFLLERAVKAVEPREDGAKDIRHLVGGPGKPLILDDQGRNVERVAVQRPDLPIIPGV